MNAVESKKIHPEGIVEGKMFMQQLVKCRDDPIQCFSIHNKGDEVPNGVLEVLT